MNEVRNAKKHVARNLRLSHSKEVADRCLLTPIKPVVAISHYPVTRGSVLFHACLNHCRPPGHLNKGPRVCAKSNWCSAYGHRAPEQPCKGYLQVARERGGGRRKAAVSKVEQSHPIILSSRMLCCILNCRYGS